MKPGTNRLARESSPYLLQHADNPVDWYPWGEEALRRAREENKPILLSIGYSACHWCHVMAHESFEDNDVARVMNDLYINIKVDREERPDLDKIYQLAHQAMTQRGGGWPLTIFLTPDEQLPIFAGTYFPKQPRHGMPGFIDVLQRVEAFYRQRPDDLAKQSNQLRNFLDQYDSADAGNPAPVDAQWLMQARRNLQTNFDYEYGGFGSAPKFPHPTNLERLLRHWAASLGQGTEDTEALHLARQTLQNMAAGGIYDQLGGGFCRYSVDAQWMIPHFEKMLYDNGPLLALYADAWAATGDKTFKRVAEETATWVMRDMQSPAGGYYSTLDADSEGEEGKFYVWTRQQIDELLDADTAQVFKRHYGMIDRANFEGRWHLHVAEEPESIADAFGWTVERVADALADARKVLLAERNKRVKPGRDEKVLVSWNGLMIKGMAVAGHRLQRQDFIDSAEQALDFIRSHLWQNGRLLAAFKDGKARLSAYLDDYVFVIDGILSLLEARWRKEDLLFAVELLEVVLAHYQAEDGGFYFTADDHEALIQRPRGWMDEAVPAGNGIAAIVLLRLGYLLAEPRYISAAERTLHAAAGAIQDYPHAHCSLLHATEEYLSPTETVILRGGTESLKAWTQQLSRRYRPARMVLAIPTNENPGFPSLDAYTAQDDGVRGYVCRAGVCEKPVDDLAQLGATE